MAHYVKKPVVIQAYRLGSPEQMPEPFVTALLESFIEYLGGNQPWLIHTLEGTMWASDGDWIIRGVEGEFYPCKHSIFEATYELASTMQIMETEKPS